MSRQGFHGSSQDTYNRLTPIQPPHLERLSPLGVLLALCDPHHGREDEHKGGAQHGAAEAHHEPKVGQEHADGREHGQQQGGAHLALSLRRVLFFWGGEGGAVTLQWELIFFSKN